MGSEREEPKTELVCNLRLRSCAHSVFLFYFCSFPNKLAAPKAADPPKIETKVRPKELKWSPKGLHKSMLI